MTTSGVIIVSSLDDDDDVGLYRGVARIFGLGGGADHVVWSPTLRAPKLRSPWGGGLGPPRRRILPILLAINSQYTGCCMLCGVAIINKHRPFNRCLTFYGPFKEKGWKIFCHPLLWGGTCPPSPSSYASGDMYSNSVFCRLPHMLIVNYNMLCCITACKTLCRALLPG